MLLLPLHSSQQAGKTEGLHAVSLTPQGMDVCGWKEMEVALVNFDNSDEIQEEPGYATVFDPTTPKGRLGGAPSPTGRPHQLQHQP